MEGTKQPGEELEGVDLADDNQAGETLEGTQGEDLEGEGEEAEMIVTIEGEEPEEQEAAPEWVKEVRKDNKKLKQRVKELEKEKQATVPEAGAPGKKPTLEDHEFNPDTFETALIDWYNKDRAHNEKLSKQQTQKKQDEDSWNGKLADFAAKKTELKLEDFEEAEAVVVEVLSTTQQGMIIQGADNAALLTYALGKNPKKAKELSLINDPVKFAFAVAKLEVKLKVTKTRPSTNPETKIKGFSKGGASDKTLERLEADADKTGDRSKVAAYRKKLKA